MVFHDVFISISYPFHIQAFHIHFISISYPFHIHLHNGSVWRVSKGVTIDSSWPTLRCVFDLCHCIALLDGLDALLFRAIRVDLP